MPFLVADTSIVIDLDRATLVEAAFNLQDTLVVPDLLYAQELNDDWGLHLCGLGLLVEALPAETVQSAVALRRAHPQLSAPDCFALALAEARSWTLLTGDRALRDLAVARQLDCHGVLWLFDMMHVQAAATPAALHQGLSALAAHPRCRLPGGEIDRRLAEYLDLI